MIVGVESDGALTRGGGRRRRRGCRCCCEEFGGEGVESVGETVARGEVVGESQDDERGRRRVVQGGRSRLRGRQSRVARCSAESYHVKRIQ